MTDIDYVVRTPYQRLHARRRGASSATRETPNEMGRVSCAKCSWSWSGPLSLGIARQLEHRAEHPPEKPEKPERKPSKRARYAEAKSQALESALEALRGEKRTSASRTAGALNSSLGRKDARAARTLRNRIAL